MIFQVVNGSWLLMLLWTIANAFKWKAAQNFHEITPPATKPQVYVVDPLPI